MAFGCLSCANKLLLLIISLNTFQLILFLLPAVSSGRQAVQPRFLHGLSSENPMTLPPSAYGFFHPEETGRSPVPPPPPPKVLTHDEYDQPLRSSLTSETQLSRSGVGGAAGVIVIVVGLISVVLAVAFPISYMALRRRANADSMSH